MKNVMKMNYILNSHVMNHETKRIFHIIMIIVISLFSLILYDQGRPSSYYHDAMITAAAALPPPPLATTVAAAALHQDQTFFLNIVHKQTTWDSVTLR